MSASRDFTGNSDSPFYMPPDVRAEALCDEMQSAATPPNSIDFCICGLVRRSIEAALAHPKPEPVKARKKARR